MKKIYLDIMEKTLSAYTPDRIREYIQTVRTEGLTEHGFARLGANIGILLAYGRRPELFNTFVEIMDICCEQMPRVKAANDFSIREVCCCLMLMEEKKLLPASLLEKWKAQLSAFDPWHFYDDVDDKSGRVVHNWALFAAVSEYVRGKYCGIDTSAFVDWQLPSQIRNLDANDMYKDGSPHKNPMVYDLVPRLLFAFLLRFGYDGQYKDRLVAVLDRTTDITLKLQSVTGETPFGGRSNQFLNNEPMLSSYFELEAIRHFEMGDTEKAEECKAAAALALQNVSYYLTFDPISHVKNRFDPNDMIGCEAYGYFNKYMITLASNLYMGALFANENIPTGKLKNKETPYIFSTTDEFNKTVLCAGGYFLEFDTDANLQYDANGLGRVQRAGCCPVVCLAVPFPGMKHPTDRFHFGYKLEKPNPAPMALGCEGGAEVPYTLLDSRVGEKSVEATFSCEKGTESYFVSADGVDITYGQAGFMLPVFDFDGERHTEMQIEQNRITVAYQNSLCIYTFDGSTGDFSLYSNRNGRYRVYRIDGKKLHIEIKETGK